MNGFTLEDLGRILVSCSGEDTALELTGEVVTTPFEDLGYDSLALLELASQVQRIYRIPMPDEAITHMQTPLAAVAYVNSRMSEVTV